MRIFAFAMICWGIAGVAAAQNTLKTWTVAGTICGVRREGSEVRRFIVTDTPNGVAYDFAPSAAKWHDEWCDRAPNAPTPSFSELMAKLEEKPDCARQAANWAKMTPAQRREVAALNARISGSEVTDCGLRP